MKDIDQAVREEIAALKTASEQFPEMADEFLDQAFGVFRLWMNLAGYQCDDENQTIADMRDACIKW